MIQLHPRSLLVGLALGGAVLFSLAQSVTKATPVTPLVRVEYLPHPRDMFQVKQGAPFTVPAGKRFVLTAIGEADGPFSSGTATLMVDGAIECVAATLPNSSQLNLATMVPVPMGRVCDAGATVEVTSAPNPVGRAWGYLADADASVPPHDRTLRVPYRPHPADLVEIRELIPYTVPTGKILVITALGATGTNPSPTTGMRLKVNGGYEVAARRPTTFATTSDAAVPEGLTCAGGDVVEVEAYSIASGYPPTARAWGYLADQ